MNIDDLNNLTNEELTELNRKIQRDIFLFKIILAIGLLEIIALIVLAIIKLA